MNNAVVYKIRPVTWKICVQGESSAQYVRNVLAQAGFHCLETQQEPDLHDPAVYSFVATPKGETPMSARELMALMEHDENIELAFTEEV